MKQILLTLAVILTAFLGYTQKVEVDHFTLSSASLNAPMKKTDSIFINQGSIIKVQELSGGGSNVEWIDADGRIRSQDVREQWGDSLLTKPTATITFSFLGDTLDSITVNGVTIIRNLTAGINGQTADSVAHYVADTITAFTSSPNYTATFSDSTITITTSAAGSAASNGFLVRTIYDGTVDNTVTSLTGGFYRRNIANMFGSSSNNQLFEVELVGVSQDVFINAARVRGLANKSGGGTIIKYDKRKTYDYSVTNKRTTLAATISGK